MRDWQGKRYWLIGASEGLGKALAEKLSRMGAEVIVSSRSEDALAKVVGGLHGRASYQAVAMANINFTGYMRVLGQVVPAMVARDAGHIVITSSLTGFRGLPGSIGYTASKAANMSLAECMYADLRKTGVDVQVANPGFIKTRLTDKNDFKMPFIMEPEAAAVAMFDHMNTTNFKTSFPTVFSWVFRVSQFLPDWAYFRIFGK
jgi:short-subunit dehydrogenase